MLLRFISSRSLVARFLAKVVARRPWANALAWQTLSLRKHPCSSGPWHRPPARNGHHRVIFAPAASTKRGLAGKWHGPCLAPWLTEIQRLEAVFGGVPFLPFSLFRACPQSLLPTPGTTNPSPTRLLNRLQSCNLGGFHKL